MKKILLVAFAMTLVSGVVFADSHLSLRVAKTARTQKERNVSGSLKAIPKTPVKPLRAVPAPERIVMSAEAAVHNETKLVKYELEMNNNGSVDHDVVTFTYDEYGFPRVISGVNFQTTFTYEWKEPGKVWSKRTVENKNSTGTTTSVKSREFHSNGMISKETDEQSGRVLEFDENGYLTKSINSEGFGETYLYFAPADRWYQGYIDPDRIEEYIVDGNGVVFCRKEKIEGEWRTIQRRGEYYDKNGIQCGNMEEYYTQDGTSFVLGGCSGYRGSITETSTERTELNETYIMPGVWIPSSKCVYSINYYDVWKEYSPSETRYYKNYEYNADNKEWELRSEYTYSWVNEKIVKEEEFYYEDDERSTSYYLVTEPDDEYDDGLLGISYDTKTGDYAYSESDPDNYEVEYYYICRADGTVLKKFREENYLWQEWNGTAWVKCTGTIKVAEDSYDSYEITFDTEGRVTRMDEYEDGKIYCYEIYTYGPGNAVTVVRYDPASNGGFYKYYEEYVNRDADGKLIEEWYKSYSEQGEAQGGFRREYFSDNRTKQYNLNEGEWQFSSWYKEPDMTVAEDGTQTIINYELDENGNITSRSKNIEWNGDNGSYKLEYYTWDDVVNDWVGQNKWENITSPLLDFVCIWPENPENVEKEFVFQAPASGQNGYWTDIRREWQWNADTKSWDLSYEDGKECSYEGNVLTVKELSSYGANTLQAITVNEDRKVIKNNIRRTIYEEITTNDNTWKYDNDGRVAGLTRSREIQQAGNIVGMTSEIYRYFYAEIPVVGSGIEEVATEAGKEVKAVYRLDGVKVEADALTPGIYVVTYSDGSVRKITIK